MIDLYWRNGRDPATTFLDRFPPSRAGFFTSLLFFFSICRRLF